MRFFKNPRVYIYTAAALFAAFFFNYQQKLNAARQKRPVAVPTVHQAPVVKPAELAPATECDYKLYLFGTPEDLPFVQNLCQSLAEKCSVLHIKAADEDIRQFFKLTSLPAAVLFNAENEAIAHFQGPFAEESLREAVQKKLGL